MPWLILELTIKVKIKAYCVFYLIFPKIKQSERTLVFVSLLDGTLPTYLLNLLFYLSTFCIGTSKVYYYYFFRETQIDFCKILYIKGRYIFKGVSQDLATSYCISLSDGFT